MRQGPPSTASLKPSTAPRKSPLWDAQLARERFRHHIGTKEVLPKKTTEGWIRAYAGQTLSAESVSVKLTLRGRARANYLRAWSRTQQMQFTLGAPEVGVVGLGSHAEAEESEAGLQTISWPALESIGEDPRSEGFNVISAIWLTIWSTIKSFRDLGSKGWIVGVLVAASCRLLGGFNFALVSAIALAALNSVIQIFVDIRQGNFTATRMFSRIGQFPAFMGFIALGRIADYGTQEHIIIFRSLMVFLVNVVCFWSCFRGFALLAGLEAVEELIEDLIDACTKFLDRQRLR